MKTISKYEGKSRNIYNKKDFITFYIDEKDELNKLRIFCLKQKTTKKKILNKDISHLINNNSQNSLEEINKDLNDNKTSDEIIMLPIINWKNILNNTSISYLFPQKEKNNNNKSNSTLVKNYNNKDEEIIPKKKIFKNKLSKILINNNDKNKSQYNFNDNKKGIIKEDSKDSKRIINNIKFSQTIRTKRNNNVLIKVNIMKNNDFSVEKIKERNIKPILSNSKSSPILINNSSSNISEKNKNKYNNYICNKSNIINNNIKLDEYYLNSKLKDTKKEIENRYKAKNALKNKKILNNSSIKKNICIYNEIISRLKRMTTLEKIKINNKKINDFHNNSSINLRNEENKKNNINNKIFNYKEKIINDKNHKTIKIGKNLFCRRENTKNQLLELLVNQNKSIFKKNNESFKNNYRKFDI